MENARDLDAKLVLNRSSALFQFILSLVGLFPACAGLLGAFCLGPLPGIIVLVVFGVGCLLLRGYYRIYKGKIPGGGVWVASFCYNGVLLLAAMVLAVESKGSLPVVLVLILPAVGVILGASGIFRTRKIENNLEA